MWAVGLKAALDNREKRLDEAALAELLHEEKRDDNLERIRKWINLKLQVSPAMQWQLVDLLEVPHSQLFAPVLQDRDIWAPHLRHVIESRGERAHQLADRLGLDVERIHAWKEIEAPVPTAMQDRLMSTLERSFTALFEPEPKEPDWLIMANGLGQAIDRKYGKRDLEAFAAEVDVDVARVQDWIDRKKAVAKDAQKTIERVLGPAAPDDLFSPPRLGS
jgi:DNA-binding transcriptional regulator YiaG